MRFPSSTPRGEHANHGRWFVERSCASKSNASRAPPRALSHCDSGWDGPTSPDLGEVCLPDLARFSIEHTFRFFKQSLRWTTPKLRSPAAADRWMWLLILAYLQLRLARDAVADIRLPWCRPYHPSAALLHGSTAAFRTSSRTWAAQRTHQNPVEARLGVLMASVLRPLSVSPQPN